MFALWFCFGITALYLASVIIRKKDIFNPITLVISLNFFTLGIAHTAIDPHWNGLQPITWAVILISSLTLFVGGQLVEVYTQSGRHDTQMNLSHLSSTLNNYSWTRHFRIGLALFFIMLLGFSYIYVKSGGIPIFHPEKNLMTRSGSIDFGFFAPFVLRGPEVFLVFLLATYKKINPHLLMRRWAIVMAIITLILSLCFFQSRMNVLTCIVFITYLHHNFKRQLGLRHFVIILAFFSSIFVFIAILRNQMEMGEHLFKTTEALKLPYQYIANNWWNLDYGLNPEPGQTVAPFKYGWGFIEGISFFFPDAIAMGVAFNWDTIFNESVVKVTGLNTVTWHWSVYNEFGYFGIIVFPLFFGIFIQYFYQYLKQKPTLIKVGIYSYLSIFLMLSWFEEFYQNALYIYWVLTIVITIKLAQANQLTRPK